MKETIMKMENEKKGLQMQVDQMGFNMRNMQNEMDKMTFLLEERKNERKEALKQVISE